MKTINDEKLQREIGFAPFDAQKRIIESPADEKVVVCGRRFGKSTVSAYLALKKLLIPGTKVWVVAPCVDEETEIMTRRGWLRYSEVGKRDETLTLNKDGKAEWQKIKDMNIFEREGKMYKQELKGHSSITTKDHKWLVGYVSHNTPNGERPRTLGYRFTKTSDLNKSNEFVLGSAPVLNLPKNKTYSDAIVELVGWWWTEGTENGNGINITQNEGDNSDRINKACENGFGEPQEPNNKIAGNDACWTEWRKKGDKNPEQGVVYLNKRASDKIKALAPDKVISTEFINSLTKEQLTLLLEVSILADGHERKRNGYRERLIVQKDKERLDRIQMVAQLAGYQTKMNRRQREEDKHCEMWSLSIYERNKHWLGQEKQREKREVIDYKGKVWCPTTSNGTWLARRNGTVYFTGNSYDLSKIVYTYVLGFLQKLFPPEAYDAMASANVGPYIKLPNDSLLEGKSSHNEKSLLGQSVDFLVVDEAAQIPESIYQEYLSPTLADKRGKVVFISTPMGKNWLYRKFNNVPDNGRFQFKSIDNPYFPKEQWEKRRGELPEDVFAQWWEAKFVDSAGTVFKTEKIDKIINSNSYAEPKEGKLYSMGVDMAKHKDFFVITVVDQDNRVVYWERSNKESYTFQKDRVVSIARKYNNARIWLDSTGVGEPVYDDLFDEGLIVDDFHFSNSSKRRLIDKLRILIEEEAITIPAESVMINELKNFQKEATPSGKILYHAPEGYDFHDDCVDSLALALWEAETTPVKHTENKMKEELEEGYLEKMRKKSNSFT